MTMLTDWPDARGGIWVAMPYKGPTDSKRRLAGLLDDDERKKLSLAMFQAAMGAVLKTPGINTVLLLTPAHDFGAWSERPRLLTINDDRRTADGAHEPDGLNRALRSAQKLATEGGADRLLIVPADLPLLHSSDLIAMIEAGKNDSVVIAPDRDRVGTNALLLAPPTAIEPSFGDDSYALHRRAAESRALSMEIIERPGLLLDLDTPADISILLEIGADFRVTALLRDLGVPERLHRDRR